MKPLRVSVVGVGACTPAGTNAEAYWAGLVSGESTARRTSFDKVPGWTALVCPVDESPWESMMAPHEMRRLDRPHLLAHAAATEATSGVLDVVAEARCGVCVGSGYAGPISETQGDRLRERGLRATSPLGIPLSMPNSVAAHLALGFGFRGPVLTHATACASGAVAIGEAAEMLQAGRADLMLAGGVDSLIYANPMAGFERLGAMSSNIDDPSPSRPFDARRDGFVMGEGAAFVALMRTDDAEALGLAVHGEIIGYSTNNDAHHLVAPDPDGRGAEACMRDALRRAEIDPDDVGHVNAHGTSTPLNDLAEAGAISRLFGDATPVTAPKGVTGHMIGGSGAAEAVATLLACRRRLVPPIGGLVEIDPGVTVDVVTETPRRVESAIGITNSFAFGGHNASLVVAA